MKNFQKSQKSLIGGVLLALLSITLMSLQKSSDSPPPPDFKNIFLTITDIMAGNWRFDPIHQDLANRIPLGGEPWTSTYRRTAPNGLSKVDIFNLVNIPYLNNSYYATGGANPQRICIDGFNTVASVFGGINPDDNTRNSIIYKGAQVNTVGTVWFQLMSQCENGKGLWWKYDRLHVPGDYPLSINDLSARATLRFQFVTTNCVNNGKKYGCSPNDNK